MEYRKNNTRGHGLSCPRLIAGFIGVGKTSYCNIHSERAIDFGVLPFKYPAHISEIRKTVSGGDRQCGRNVEALKGNLDWEMGLAWHETYYDALLQTYREYPGETIVIPTDGAILRWLDRDGIPFTLVYPCVEARLEYRKRLQKRGNSTFLLEVFTDEDSWADWMEQLRRPYTHAERIELKEGQYLSDGIGALSVSAASAEEGRTIENPWDYILDRYFPE